MDRASLPAARGAGTHRRHSPRGSSGTGLLRAEPGPASKAKPPRSSKGSWGWSSKSPLLMIAPETPAAEPATPPPRRRRRWSARHRRPRHGPAFRFPCHPYTAHRRMVPRLDHGRVHEFMRLAWSGGYAAIARSGAHADNSGDHVPAEDLLTERPALRTPRSCHNAQAEPLRRPLVFGSDPSVDPSRKRSTVSAPVCTISTVRAPLA
jgi:hypothetical protein